MATGSGDAVGPSRQTKGQKRLDHILERIPIAREQLLAAIDDLAPALTSWRT
jgi:hypothetical protein